MSLICKPENHVKSTKALYLLYANALNESTDVFDGIKTENLLKMDDYAEFLDEVSAFYLSN